MPKMGSKKLDVIAKFSETKKNLEVSEGQSQR